MTKKIISQYSLPLTDAERKEILDMLKPAYIQKEKVDTARDLQRRILDEVYTHLHAIGPKYFLNDEGTVFSPAALNAKLKEKVSDWYTENVMRLGSEVNPEDLAVEVSTDGLYVLKYSKLVKKIITTYDFDLEVLEYKLPDNDPDLVRAINERLEQEPIE